MTAFAPDPQAGRCSANSGRAVQTTSSARPRLRPRSCSTTSSRRSSAQCTSSSTIATVPAAASAPTRREAAQATSGRPADAARVEAGGDGRRVGVAGHRRGDRMPMRAPTAPRAISRSGSSRRSGRRPAVSREHGQRRRASRGTSAASRDLPIPGWPSTVTRWGRCRRAVRSSAQRSISTSASRPIMGRSSRRRWPRAAASTPSSRQATSGSRFPFAGDRGHALAADGVGDQRPGRLADQHLARAGRLLEARRHVHGVADDQRLARRGVAGEHVAGVHADPGLDLAQRAHRVAHLERRPHRPERVVLVDDGDPEHRHERVADHLLDRAAVALDRLADRGVEPRHHAPHHLGVGALARARSIRRRRRRAP